MKLLVYVTFFITITSQSFAGCFGEKVYCGGKYNENSDTCDSYYDYETQEFVYYATCSESTSTGGYSTPCSSDHVQCVHYNPGRVVTHIGYDSCGNYTDYETHSVVTYPYCSK